MASYNTSCVAFVKQIVSQVFRSFFLSSILIVRGEAASTRREAPREKNNRSVSGALSNRKHGLFHIRYFENGPLEPGYLTGGLR